MVELTATQNQQACCGFEYSTVLEKANQPEWEKKKPANTCQLALVPSIVDVTQDKRKLARCCGKAKNGPSHRSLPSQGVLLQPGRTRWPVIPANTCWH